MRCTENSGEVNGKTTLDKIPLNCEVYIDSIECGNGIKNRILIWA